MPYSPTTWVDDTTKLNAAHMNNIEQGIVTADTNATAAVPSPASISSGEVPVWNGSAWVRSSVTKIASGMFAGILNADVGAGAAIAYSKLALTGAILNADLAGSIAGAKLAFNFATSLPGSPADQDIAILVDSTSAPTYSWMFRYVSAKASNKWQFIGGIPIYAEVTTSETTTSTTYAALATAGPSIAVPVAGDYMVSIGCQMGSSVALTTSMSYDIGGTGAVDADAAQVLWGGGVAMPGNAAVRLRKKAGLTAITLTSKYKTSTGTGSFSNRFIQVIPIAIGG